MDFEDLIRLIETVSKSGLTGFKYENGGMKLQMSKKTGQRGIQVQADETPVQLIPAAQTEETGTPKGSEMGKIMQSPLVGTFYAAPAEDAAPYVSVGDTVKKGQTLAIIEAMKLMNEIESEYDGVIKEIYVSNGQAVEYGQDLFCIG